MPVMNRLLVFPDSMSAMDQACSIAAKIEALCLTTRCCSWANAGVLPRRAREIHLSRASGVWSVRNAFGGTADPRTCLGRVPPGHRGQRALIARTMRAS